MIIAVNYKAKATDEIIIPTQSLRLRIIANSNNVNDWQIKMQVKENLEELLSDLLAGAKTLDDSVNLIENNMMLIDEAVSSVLTPLNETYQINFGPNAFPVKTYKGILYPAGNYDSLVIKIGAGAGDNWWCVLFPPLCFLETNDTSEVEYQLYVSRIINYFK